MWEGQVFCMDSIEIYYSKLGVHSKFLFGEIYSYFRYMKKFGNGYETCRECVLQNLVEGKHRTYCCVDVSGIINNKETSGCRYYKGGVKPCGKRTVFTWLT